MDPGPASLLIFFYQPESAVLVKVLCIILLLCCSALISGAEVALFSLTASDINGAETSKSSKGKIISALLEKPKKLLATILVSNNFVNICIVLLFSSLSEVLFGNINGEILGLVDYRFVVEVVVVSFVLLLFGEILPKIYASRNRVKFAYFVAQPLNVLDKLLVPFSIPMRATTLYLQKRLGRQKSNISVNQLSQALELTSEESTTSEEQKILQGIVTFGNTETRQVMKPRIDIFALNEELKFPEVVQEILKNGYSRIPVYADNIDNVTGILYVKDLLPYIDRKAFDWVSLKREPYFVPENKKLDDLLAEFQKMKNHLAIVVDEYGGTSGLISLEDIIEEIVGDISDEFDDDDLVYSKLDDHNFVFEGKTPLKDFYRVMRLEDEEVFENSKGEAETLAGFLLEIAGGFPKKGEKIGFETFIFTVEALDKKRIKQIKVTVAP